jgi:hypothetical protein
MPKNVINEKTYIPKRIWIMPEYGQPWAADVLRTYDNNTIAIVHPDNAQEDDTRKIDLENTGWASLDNNQDKIE